MKQHVLTALLAVSLSPMWLSIPAKADYTPNFNSGRLPEGMTVENANGLAIPTECYAVGHTADGWMITRVGTQGYCAVSPTHSRTEEACENILSLPELEIEDGMWLRWEALSVSPDFPEAYEVRAIIEGYEEPVALFKTEEEAGRWITRICPLYEYAGKKVRIEFVCRSVNKFMLAIHGIAVTVPSESSFYSVDHTPRFAGMSDSTTAAVNVAAVNVGKDFPLEAVECIDEEGNLLASIQEWNVWKTAEDRRFELAIPAEIGKTISYKVEAVGESGERVALAENRIYVSYFPRTVLVDKGTGMWCQNCTKGILNMESLKDELGDLMVGVDTHCMENLDVLTNDGYWQQLGFYAAPYFKIDRIAKSAADNVAGFDKYYERPVECKVSVSDINLAGNESAEITAVVENAVGLDNSADRYRLGYVVTADFFRPDDNNFYQKNTATNPSSAERFYFMPARIPADMIVFHDVSLTHEDAFTGISGSLPRRQLEPGETHEFRWSFSRPELIDNICDADVAVYLIDTDSGEIMNAASVSLDSGSGVDKIMQDDKFDGEPEYFTLQGFRVSNPSQGIYLVRRGSSVSKEIIR